ncbi:hypothetical protein SERLA73DRAFT_44780 [Serpula lacrymans var. lacrymans S7.3]|uniref:Uncharacterized protein n=1 Tax=Serpula lacrymans var. lacrymans (strain S7.3) TaxID=936435 RepID=F8PGM5_SERL3|nr:hypothetical protein SERLA73DRAFT_44780 [Serpula lacrymans var. lacrymans S7.3]
MCVKKNGCYKLNWSEAQKSAIDNAFHGYAHNWRCQLLNHPFYLTGFGLEDMETCE